MARKPALGRGLSSLIGDVRGARTAEPEAGEKLASIAIEKLQPGKYQPRSHMDNDRLAELADSIRAQGLIQPIIVRAIAAGRYEIIAGERRWRAAQLASLREVPVVIRDIEDNAALAMALIENIQREDLNPIEEAMALQRLQQEFELTQQEVANAVGKSRVTVTNLLRLMALPDDVKLLLERGDIEMGHARALLGLPLEQQTQAARQVVAKGLTVRQTEALVRQWLNPRRESAQVRSNPDIDRLQLDLSERLGAEVKIQHGNKGKGKLVISYSSLDELDGVLMHIK